LLRKCEEKKPFGRYKHGWENNMKMSLRNKMWGYPLDSYDSGQSDGGLLWIWIWWWL
jgi:hypothetical protein